MKEKTPMQLIAIAVLALGIGAALGTLLTYGLLHWILSGLGIR